MTREEYAAYLASPIWAARRETIMKRANGRCEDCVSHRKRGGFGLVWPAQHIHHLTYDRVGDEALSDLVALCERHHRIRHDLDEQTNRERAAALRQMEAAHAAMDAADDAHPEIVLNEEISRYCRNLYEERAAIIEYDGNRSRSWAERAALNDAVEAVYEMYPRAPIARAHAAALRAVNEAYP